MGNGYAFGVGIVAAKLTNLVLPTRDLDRVEAFYRDVFGFEPFHRDETCRFLRTGATHLVFVLSEESATGVCLDLSVADLDLAASAFEAVGVAFRRESGMLVLRDPDGNLVELVKG